MAEPPDGGWGWVIVIATFLTSFLSVGSVYSVGVIYAALLDAFGKSKATTAWVASICTFVTALSFLFGVASARRIGHRKSVMLGGLLEVVGFLSSAFVTNLYQLYFTYGVLVGIGAGISYICCIEVVGQYFKRKLSIALGLGLAGAGAGQLVLSFLCQLLVDTYGWRGMLMIMSAVMAHLFVAGALLRPYTENTVHSEVSRAVQDRFDIDGATSHDKLKIVDSEDNMAFTKEIDIENRQCNEHRLHECSTIRPRCCPMTSFFKNLYSKSLMCEPVFRLQLVINILNMVGVWTVIVHVVRHSRDLGIPPTLSSFTSAAIGLAQLVGRPLFGVMGYSLKVKPYVMYSIAAAGCGVGTITSVYSRNLAGQLIAVLLVGMGIGGCSVYVPVLLAFFHGTENIGLGLSLIVQTHGIMGLIMPPFAGWMRDTNRNYIEAFWLAAASFLLAAAVSLSLPFVNSIVNRKRRLPEDRKPTLRYEH